MKKLMSNRSTSRMVLTRISLANKPFGIPPFLVTALLLAVGLTWFGVSARDAAASPPISSNPRHGTLNSQTPPIQAGDDTACILCHSRTDGVITFSSGETMAVQVNIEQLAASAHGGHNDTNLPCTACHLPAHYQYPHTPPAAPDYRSYQITQSLATCERCHQPPHLTSHPASGDTRVACVDCHGGHNVQPKESWYAGEGLGTCAACHLSNEVSLTARTDLRYTIQNGLFAATSLTNQYCDACHSLENLSLTLANGDILDLTVKAATLAESVHGAGNTWSPLLCTDCHDGYLFPHEQAITATSVREYSLEKYPLCGRCHEPKYDQAMDSVHAVALAAGNLDAAVCTDCHGAHDTPKPDEPRERLAQTCQQCHSTIYDEYAASVHGAALLSENNPDVPTCIDCHGVHNINDPTTALFRVRSPQLCAGCHADPALMGQYDISTDVFNTYVADFHGTTVTLFEHQDPTVETNKAVCYDCHGVHNILRPDDPEAGIKANLLETCQQCHPNATTNFPDSWTSHFRPSLEHNPLVFLVNSFYWVVIPATLAFFGFLVLTDIYRRLIVDRRLKQ